MSMFARRPAHPRRGGERPRRAARAPAPVGRHAADDGGAWSTRCSPTCVLGRAGVRQPDRPTRSPCPTPSASGVGLTLAGWFFSGTALRRRAAHHQHPRRRTASTGAVIGAAYVLRAIGDVGSPRAELAVARSGGTRRCTPSRACGGGRSRCSPPGPAVVVAPGSRRLRPARLRLGRARRPARARRGPGPASTQRRSAWPGGSSGRRSSGWALGLLFTRVRASEAWATACQDLIGDSAYSRDVFLQGSPDLVDGFYATADRDARPVDRRLRRLLGAAAPR